MAVKAKGLWAKVSKVRYSKVRYSNGNSKWKKYATCYKSHNDYLHIKKGLNSKIHVHITKKQRRLATGVEMMIGGGVLFVGGAATSETGIGEVGMYFGQEFIVEGGAEILDTL